MPGRRSKAGVLALVATLTIVALAPSRAGAAWVVKGHGFGHGIGFSQYGAYGFAQHGMGYQAILAHYYTGTTIGNAGGNVVRVLVGTGGDTRFSNATSACGQTLDPSRTYRAHPKGGGVRLLLGSGKAITDCGAKLHANGNGYVNIGGVGKYRGAFEAVPSGGGLNLVNALGVDEYAQGVVAREMPSSWPLAALRAQAVAVRSYGLTSSVGGKGFNLYADTRSQVYGGMAAETARTNQAVQSTAGQTVTYNGKTAQTFFFACSGGMTENIEFAFIGSSPVPYLKGVPDPYDGACPLHSWTRSFSPSSLGGYFSGRFKGLRVTKTGVSPRVVYAKVLGSRGSKTIRGDTLQSAVGGYSSWIRIKRR
jgi:stage II sporulation protein D